MNAEGSGHGRRVPRYTPEQERNGLLRIIEDFNVAIIPPRQAPRNATQTTPVQSTLVNFPLDCIWWSPKVNGRQRSQNMMTQGKGQTPISVNHSPSWSVIDDETPVRFINRLA